MRNVPRVSTEILLHSSWQTLIFENQPFPYGISLIFPLPFIVFYDSFILSYGHIFHLGFKHSMFLST